MVPSPWAIRSSVSSRGNALVLGLAAFKAGFVSERASDPTLARAARAGDQDIGGIADPGAVAEAEHEAAVEPAGAAQIDILEAGVLVGAAEPS